MPDNEDFYEEDEPIEEIVAAFETGETGLTGSRYQVIEPSPTFGGSTTIVRDPFVPVLTIVSGNTVQAGLAPVS